MNVLRSAQVEQNKIGKGVKRFISTNCDIGQYKVKFAEIYKVLNNISNFVLLNLLGAVLDRLSTMCHRFRGQHAIINIFSDQLQKIVIIPIINIFIENMKGKVQLLILPYKKQHQHETIFVFLQFLLWSRARTSASVYAAYDEWALQT